jgi:hypothetical protein
MTLHSTRIHQRNAQKSTQAQAARFCALESKPAAPLCGGTHRLFKEFHRDEASNFVSKLTLNGLVKILTITPPPLFR